MANSYHKGHLKQYLNSHKRTVRPSEDGGSGDDENLKKTNKKSTPSGLKSQTKLSGSSANPPRSTQSHSPGAIPKTSSTRGLTKGFQKLTIKGKPSFDWLPDELILQIFGFLDVTNLLGAGRVCKRWRGLANDNVLWEPLYKIHCRQKVKKKIVPTAMNWKKDCISRCIKVRNDLAFPTTKRKDLKSQKAAFKKIGCRFHLSLIGSSYGQEPTLKHSSMFVCTHALTVTWYNLELPPIRQIKKLQVYSSAPVFFDNQQKTIKNSPCTRSLLIDIPFDWRKWSSTQPPGGSDDRVHVYFLPDGLIIGTWKEDGELAFISLCLHFHKLRERCLYGSSSGCYQPPPHSPIFDDIDSQYGLHDYTCYVELRNQKSSIWSQEFIKLHCKKEDLADGYATLSLIRPDHSVDHTILTSDQRLELPWKTDLFNGIIKNVCILDMTLDDEHNTTLWKISSPVKVTPTGDSTSYDYDGNTYSIHSRDERGEVTVQLVWLPDREQYYITGLLVSISVKFINEWFGTKYSAT